MHYKPIWISNLDACNHNHDLCVIICAKWGVCLGVSMSQGLYLPSKICQKCWWKRTIVKSYPTSFQVGTTKRNQTTSSLEFWCHLRSSNSNSSIKQNLLNLMYSYYNCFIVDYLVWWYYHVLIICDSQGGDMFHMVVILFGIGCGCTSIFVTTWG
jgi:hypothetical protein